MFCNFHGNFCMLIEDLLFILGVQCWRKFYTACFKHLHSDVKADFIATLVTWDHIVRDNMSSLRFSIGKNISEFQKLPSHLHWLVFHSFIVLWDFQFTTLTGFIIWLVFSVAGCQKLICLPKFVILIEALYFVTQARMLHAKLKNFMLVEVWWLKLNLINAKIFFIYILQFCRRLLSSHWVVLLSLSLLALWRQIVSTQRLIQRTFTTWSAWVLIHRIQCHLCLRLSLSYSSTLRIRWRVSYSMRSQTSMRRLINFENTFVFAPVEVWFRVIMSLPLMESRLGRVYWSAYSWNVIYGLSTIS